MAEKMNEHAEIIKNTVFHVYPYNHMMFNPNDPHAEDCGGCIIEEHVRLLVEELERLSYVENIIAQLEEEKEQRRVLTLDKFQAFEKAGFSGYTQGSVANLVSDLVDERDNLRDILQRVKEDISNLLNLMTP